MLLGENISLAISSLLSNKMRALLTMLGIIIGIGAVITIFTVGNSLTLSVSENMQSVGANDIYISVSARGSESAERDPDAEVDGIVFRDVVSDTDMTEDDYITDEMIHDLAAAFEGRIYAINVSNSIGRATAEIGDTEKAVSIMGVSAGYFLSNSISIEAGSMFSQADFSGRHRVGLVEVDFAEDVFGSAEAAVGREFNTVVEGRDVTVSIVGVYKSESQYASMFSFGRGSTVYMPLQAANEIARAKGAYRTIQAVAAVGIEPDELSDDIQNFFKPYYRSNKKFEVVAYTFGGLLGILYTMLDTITTAISIVAAIALVVGGIGVMNIMLVSVTERTREIGTRKALGAKNSSIRAQFIVEATIICLIGGAIGVVFGIIAGVLASNYLGYPAQPSIGGIILALLFSMSIGIFFGYFPANKAAKMNPIDALRYE